MDGLVVAPGNRPLAVRGEGDTVHPGRVPLEAAQLLAGCHVPEAGSGVLARVADRSGEGQLAIRGEGNGNDAVGMSFKAAYLQLAGDRPDEPGRTLSDLEVI